MVFRVPKDIPVLIVQLDDETVLQGVHAHAVDVVDVPTVFMDAVLTGDILREAVCLPLLLLFPVACELAVDHAVGNGADQGDNR